MNLLSLVLGIVLGFALFIAPDLLWVMGDTSGPVLKAVVAVVLFGLGALFAQGKRSVASLAAIVAGTTLLLLTGLNLFIRLRELGGW